MRIQLNGDAADVADEATVAEVLAARGYELRYVALALNRRCLRRGDAATVRLSPGDELEILAPMAGG